MGYIVAVAGREISVSMGFGGGLAFDRYGGFYTAGMGMYVHRYIHVYSFRLCTPGEREATCTPRPRHSGRSRATSLRSCPAATSRSTIYRDHTFLSPVAVTGLWSSHLHGAADMFMSHTSEFQLARCPHMVFKWSPQLSIKYLTLRINP